MYRQLAMAAIWQEHLGDSSYLTHLSTELNRLRHEGAFCDITIVVGEQRFPAHKAVLSIASSYFQCMFSSGYRESTSSEVTVPGTGESFTQLIDFAYTGFFDLSPTNIAGILKMACYMQFNRAIAVCAEYLTGAKDKLCLDDCFEIWNIAGNHKSLSDLSEAFRQHLVHNFPQCVECGSLLEHATIDFIIECLGDEGIETDTSTEDKVSTMHEQNVEFRNRIHRKCSLLEGNICKFEGKFIF